jgi:hypothetical protein
VQVVVVIVGVGGTKAGSQEAGPHSGPTATERGYTAGESSWLGATPLWDKHTESGHELYIRWGKSQD